LNAEAVRVRVNEHRVDAVADTVAALDTDGITVFDESEPEYEFLTAACERFDDHGAVALLSVLAGTQDYMLNGDAQAFWEALSETLSEVDTLSSVSDVNSVLDTFMDEPVNARLDEQKRERLRRMTQAGFHEWFLDTYPDHDPQTVWERIADALDTAASKKTVVMAVKVYDVFSLVTTGTYLDLPPTIPVPCDVQVQRIAQSSGITDTDDEEDVMNAWQAVTQRVNDALDEPVSMLRIDSIVWQAGQIVSNHGEDCEESRAALIDHFVGAGLDTGPARSLAEELTTELD
jgi:N-glycosylase/DNA lyase